MNATFGSSYGWRSPQIAGIAHRLTAGSALFEPLNVSDLGKSHKAGQRGGAVSISRLPPERPRITLARVLWFLESPPMQTGQPQPIAGTPTLVPVPRRIIWPVISVVCTCLGTMYLLGHVVSGDLNFQGRRAVFGGKYRAVFGGK